VSVQLSYGAFLLGLSSLIAPPVLTHFIVFFSERSVHDDVQICQWLRKDDSKLKLGDFNRAEIMEYNSEEQKYCKYQNGQGWGNYRSPEEFGDHDLNEKIDVFTFGNNIYGLVRMF
jgi:hypothetical protein